MVPTLNILCMYLFITQLTNSLPKTAHLKPSSISTLSSISVSTSPGVTVTNDKWHINVLSQQGADLTISLNNEWAFHPTFPSSIQLYIQGNTPNSTYYKDGEIVFVFSVNNQYFAQEISLDKRKTAYKECPNSNTSLINRVINQMISSLLPGRYHRFCKNPSGTPINDAIDYWNAVGSIYKEPAKWPMFITITNNPILNTIAYTWTDSFAGINKVTSTYTSSFNTNQGLNIYISGDSPFEEFFIFSVDVTHSNVPTKRPTNRSTIPTTNPTQKPTINPTYKPSVNPTDKPTNNPTYKPTINPTNLPTKSPTLSPIKTPTVNPTNLPSKYPTITPTKNPSNFPTISATKNPSNFPTKNPSNFPTISATKNPSNFPTISPTFYPTIYPTQYHTINASINPSTKLPSINPANKPTFNPANKPTFNPTLTTNNPIVRPTYNPTLTFNPSISPSISTINPTVLSNKLTTNTVIATTTTIEEFEIVFALVLITVNTDINTINILFEFDYMFEYEYIVNIMNILERITKQLIINECGYSLAIVFDSGGFDYKNSNTNINANIITCDVSYSSTFIKNINNLNFENQFIISMKQEIGIQIIFKQNTIIKYTTLNSINNNNTNATILLPTINPTISSHINNQSTHTTDYSYISWMLKFILAQLGLCGVLIFCYFGLKMRIKKLKINKLAIQEQIANDQINNNNNNDNSINQQYDTNINSPKIEAVILNNDDDIVTNSDDLNNPIPLSPTDNYDKDGYNVYEIKEEEEPKYTNYYIKQLMNKMIANKNRKHKNKIDTTGTEIENSRAILHRIETDTTFPSIPMNDFNNLINNNLNDTSDDV